MQCREVEVVLEQEGLAPLPDAARAHVAGCSHCQGLIADLETIVSVSVQLPAEVEPPARIWVALRNQLEQEGIIKEPVSVSADNATSWWHGLGNLFRSRAVATATVGLLIAVAAVLQLSQSPVSTVVKDNTPGAPSWQIPFAQTRQVLNEQEVDLRNMHLSSTSPVDAALQQNLQQVDDFIADCERHLKADPQDDLAREYLSDAYQQKAELLSAMMDRGRSVN
jgi:hypothetical protein